MDLSSRSPLETAHACSRHPHPHGREDWWCLPFKGMAAETPRSPSSGRLLLTRSSHAKEPACCIWLSGAAGVGPVSQGTALWDSHPGCPAALTKPLSKLGWGLSSGEPENVLRCSVWEYGSHLFWEVSFLPLAELVGPPQPLWGFLLPPCPHKRPPWQSPMACSCWRCSPPPSTRCGVSTVVSVGKKHTGAIGQVGGAEERGQLPGCPDPNAPTRFASWPQGRQGWTWQRQERQESAEALEGSHTKDSRKSWTWEMLPVLPPTS